MAIYKGTTSLASEIAKHWDEEVESKAPVSKIPPRIKDPTGLAMQQLNSALLALKAIASDNERKANETAVVDLSLAQADAILAEKISDMLFESDHEMSKKLERFITLIVQQRVCDALVNLGNSINTNATAIARK